ncbi:hypothetical protein C3L33_14909, partial [Rhododendron williamsianum]
MFAAEANANGGSEYQRIQRMFAAEANANGGSQTLPPLSSNCGAFRLNAGQTLDKEPHRMVIEETSRVHRMIIVLEQEDKTKGNSSRDAESEQRNTSNSDMNREEFGNIMTVRAKPTEEAEEIPKVEPCKGLEFGSANEAYKFYYAYAASFGFKVRIGQLFRSKHDGSITSRRFVCSKEGHHTLQE